MNREHAIMVIKELLDSCRGLDGHSIELSSSNVPVGEYQIILKGILDAQTKLQINAITAKHNLAIQTGNLWKTKRTPNKTEPDTYMIYNT